MLARAGVVSVLQKGQRRVIDEIIAYSCVLLTRFLHSRCSPPRAPCSGSAFSHWVFALLWTCKPARRTCVAALASLLRCSLSSHGLPTPGAVARVVSRTRCGSECRVDSPECVVTPRCSSPLSQRPSPSLQPMSGASRRAIWMASASCARRLRCVTASLRMQLRRIAEFLSLLSPPRSSFFTPLPHPTSSPRTASTRSRRSTRAIWTTSVRSCLRSSASSCESCCTSTTRRWQRWGRRAPMQRRRQRSAGVRAA